MLELKNWVPQAMEKLEREEAAVTGSRERVMSAAVLSTVRDFCEQDPEFAQAVVQGGSFAECMRAVAKDVGDCISDLEAYKRAVQFYFPGAQVRMSLAIDLIGDAGGLDPKQSASPGIVLNLEDFL